MGDRECRDLLKSLRREGNREKRKDERDWGRSGEPENESEERCYSSSSWSAANSSLSSLDYHPVYHEISRRNGYLNRLDLNELRRECRENQLDTYGRKDAVRRRLKEHFKLQKLMEAGLMSGNTNRNLDFFVVIDFEATCEQVNPSDYQHEIIEFPAILVSSAAPAQVVDVFHSYCRPVINSRLSDFCRQLTNIEQSTVDKAPLFNEVFDDFILWLKKRHGLGIKHSFAIVTDGPFDMAKFLAIQLQQVNRTMPDFTRQWVNIRKAFHNFYRGSFQTSSSVPKLPGLSEMLACLELEFKGRPHSGLDDAHNIARVLLRMLKDQAFVRINEKIDDSKKSISNNKVNINGNRGNNSGSSHRVPILNVNRNEAEKWMRNQKDLNKVSR